VTLALEGQAGISRGLPPLIPAHKKNNAKLPYQASYRQWGQIGTTPDCTYSSTTPPLHITPLDNTKTELIRGTAYSNKDTRYMLHISPDHDKFFDAQETPSFSPRVYDDTQEEAFFDCMEEEDDQHYLPIQQPRLNKKRKREEGPTGNNWGKKSRFFSNRKASSEHPPTLRIRGGGHTKKHKQCKSHRQQCYKQPQMTGN
jgi:hypothetical protein